MAGVVREAGCVDSVWGAWCRFPCWMLSSVRFWIITSCPCFIIWEVLLAVARWFLTSWARGGVCLCDAYIYAYIPCLFVTQLSVFNCRLESNICA